jgi:hypothetical protein
MRILFKEKQFSKKAYAAHNQADSELEMTKNK